MYLIFAGEHYYPRGATDYIETCIDLDVAKAKAVKLLGKMVLHKYHDEPEYPRPVNEIDWVEILELPSGTVHEYKNNKWNSIPQSED